MKVWHVFRTDGYVGYDEYDGHIVAADTKEEVIDLLNERFSYTADRHGNISFWGTISRTPYKIEEVAERGIVLSSFNAG
jgi:hypothetical protein